MNFNKKRSMVNDLICVMIMEDTFDKGQMKMNRNDVTEGLTTEHTTKM